MKTPYVIALSIGLTGALGTALWWALKDDGTLPQERLPDGKSTVLPHPSPANPQGLPVLEDGLPVELSKLADAYTPERRRFTAQAIALLSAGQPLSPAEQAAVNAEINRQANEAQARLHA